MEYSPKRPEHKPHRDSAHASRTASSVYRLPEELLVSVFTILIESNPSSIGTLLFVSRYWHSVAATTASIWSKIHSRPRSLEEVKKDTKYIQTAVKNSSNLPLDVTIDLYNLEYKTSPADSYPNQSLAAVEDGQGDGADVLLFGLFKALVGDRRINVARLRSISLNNTHPGGIGVLTDEIAVKRFLSGLDCPTPLLESLSLHLPYVDHYFTGKESLQDLKALKHLIVDAGGHLGCINLIPETIQTLAFRLWSTTRVLSRFNRLRVLSIDNWPNAGVTYDADPELIFPLLKCLTWRLRYSPYLMSKRTASLPQKIRAPSLTTLRLLDAEAITVVGGADVYHHVHTLDLLSPALKEIIDFIQLHLYKYTALVNLTVLPGNLDVVKDKIRALQGQVPTGLNSLYTIISDKNGVVVDESTELPSWRPAEDYIYKKDDTVIGQ